MNEELERKFRRIQKYIRWKIYGQFQHGIAPNTFLDLTPERVEELYNVDFGN
jgi:hypothetical protein